ncbi:MAG: flavodoxin-dependent (E)-4-hydroxy-3-methylbut-2-enyl-diphosphate synthase [Candidatus Omnitrophota bacterium]
MIIKRRKTRTVSIGRVKIGSGHPIAIQSMVKVPAKKTDAAVRQIHELQALGCEIIRIAVEDQRDALALTQIKRQVRIPLVADIHFDYRLAIAAIAAGVDKVRLNPGNIYRPGEVKAVVAAAKERGIPVRIGANSGSLRIKGQATAHALVRSVRAYIKIFENKKFYNLVISLKGAHLLDTIAAYDEMARCCDYPLHLGITATGLPLEGVVKSSAGIGVLLFGGLGDTIRVSLLGDPHQEIVVAQFLLNSLGLRRFGPEFICCPTCGRCEVNLLEKAQNFKKRLQALTPAQRARLKDLTIALMGCVVNGPGEARQASAGIAFSKRKGVLFERGKIVRTVAFKDGEEELLRLIKKRHLGGNRA